MTTVATQLEAGVADAQFKPDVATTMVESQPHTVSRNVPVVDQQQSSYATGEIRVDFWTDGCVPISSCPDANATMTLPAGAVVATCTTHILVGQPCPALGRRFTVLQAVTLSASHFSETVQVRAVEPGADGNVAPGSIRVLVSPAVAASRLTVTNRDYLSGGADGNVATADPVELRANTQAASAVGFEQADRDLLNAVSARKLTAVAAIQHQISTQTDQIHAGMLTTQLRVTVRSTVLAAEADALHRSAMAAVAKLVPQGEYVVPDSLTIAPSPAAATDRVTLHVTAHLSRADVSALHDSATAHWASGEVDKLRRSFGAANVEMEQWPVALPWLPLLGPRVTVHLEPLGGAPTN